MCIILGLLAALTGICSIRLFVAATHAAEWYPWLSPLSVPHWELLAVGLAIITTLCLVGIGIIDAIHRLQTDVRVTLPGMQQALAEKGSYA